MNWVLYAFIWGLCLGLIGMVGAYALGQRHERKRVLRILDRERLVEAANKCGVPLGGRKITRFEMEEAVGQKTIGDCAARFVP